MQAVTTVLRLRMQAGCRVRSVASVAMDKSIARTSAGGGARMRMVSNPALLESRNTTRKVQLHQLTSTRRSRRLTAVALAASFL